MTRAAEAEAALCRAFAPRIRAYGLRHLGNAADADDLVQIVLSLLLDKVRTGAVDDPARLPSFVLGVCRNTVSDWRRTNTRRRNILERAAPTMQLLAQLDADAQPEPLARDRLADCLQTISQRQRTIVMLTYYAQRDGADIATELGMTPGNVRVTRHRALAALRDCVKGGAS